MFRPLLALLLVAFSPQLSASIGEETDRAVLLANRLGSGEQPYREGWFGEGDERIHYVEAGKGPLILFYHGFPSFWYSWFDQMEQLKDRYRVVAVDGLGAGLSAKPSDLAPYRVSNLARQIDKLAHELNGDAPFILVGHDWGSALALSYAQAYPGRLQAVIGMSAPPYGLFLDLLERDPEQQRRSQYMQRFRQWTRSDLETLGIPRRIAEQSYQGLVDRGALTADEAALFQEKIGTLATIDAGMNWYRANIPAVDGLAMTPRWPSANAAIDIPTLLIWGERDQTFTTSYLETMTSFAPRLTIHRLSGVGHWTPIEDPEAANQAIESFLRSLPIEGTQNRAAR